MELGGTNNKSVDAVINENEVNHFSSIKTMIHELGSLISLFSESHRDIGDYQGELNKKQSMVDKEISDIYHYIEFYTGPEDGLVEATLLLQSSLKRRREIKDELTKLSIVGETLLNNNYYSIVQCANKRIEKMKCRKYSPRVNTSLFIND